MSDTPEPSDVAQDDDVPVGDPPVEERLFEDAGAMAQALAEDLAARLEAGVAQTGAASFIASGGTTPGPVYDRLARLPVPWARVALTVSDERWAPAGDPASNSRLLHERLLRGAASAARFVSLLTDARDPHDPAAEREAGERVRAMRRPFEMAILGMGDDGHTASLFPHAPDLARLLETGDPALCRGVGPVAGAAGAPLRMTLTLRALTDARQVVILIQGDKKLATFRRAQAAGAVAAMPVRAILRQTRAPVALYWAP